MSDGNATTDVTREEPARPDSSAWATREFGDRYRIGQRLGEGGMGKVDAATDKVLKRQIAVKRVKPARRGAFAQLTKETALQAQLQHPNIIPVYDAGLDSEGLPYFTMREIEGESLADSIADGTRSTRMHMQALSRVALALKYAHERGVLHCDLKPSNVMLGDFGEVYLVDWGCAREWSKDTGAPGREIAGSPAYMAPEQAQGRDHRMGPATDVFGLGAVLFEILTGRFFGDARHEEPHSLSEEQLANCPAELAVLCLACTTRDPALRHQDAGTFYDALEAHLTGELELERRRGEAQRQTRLARAKLEELPSGEAEIQARRTAIHAIGRAIALDPEVDNALPTLQALLNVPMQVEPEEVRNDVADARTERLRRLSRVSTIAYLLQSMSCSLFLLMDVRDPRYPIAFFLCMLGSAAISFWTYKRPAMWKVTLSLLVSTIGTASLVGMFGPLFVMPMIVIVNISAYAMFLPSHVALITGTLALVLPWLLDAHVDVFSAEGILIAPRALNFHPEAALFLIAVNLLTLFSGFVVAAFFAARVRELEHRLFTQAWHFQQLLPRPNE